MIARSLLQPETMRLLVTLVLVVAAACRSYGHYIVPLESSGQLIPPYHYVVHHIVPTYLQPPQQPQPDVQQHPVSVPDVLRHPAAGPVSRETLEDTGDGFLQNVPDISDEQRSVHEDDHVQVPQVPSVQEHEVPVYTPQRPIKPAGRKPGPPGEEPKVKLDGPHADGSYGFSYSQGDQKRTEKSDKDGNVEGSYSYTGPDGKEVTVTYTAGANKGYIPVGEGLLPPPPATHDEPHQQSEEEEEEDTQQKIQPGQKRPTHHIPVTEEAEEPAHKGGMPYSYNYDADLSSKTETADDNGNVQGSYSYVDGAGIKRTVTYTVNGDEGFIASGDIHPDPGSPDTQAPKAPREPEPAPQPPSWKGSRPSTPQPPSWPQRGDMVPSVKGRPASRKGGNTGSGWDKYPLG